MAISSAPAARKRRTGTSHGCGYSPGEAAELPKTITFHDLRHYYASLLITGEPASRWSGPPRPQETLDTYGHLWIDGEELTRDGVGNELKQALTVCRVQAGDDGSVSNE